MIIFIKKITLLLVLILFLLIIIIILSVRQWSTQSEGHLPAKTAVILHAVNHNLIPANLKPPRFLTKASKGRSSLLREDLTIPTTDGKTIPIRLYKPIGEGPFPIIMYYHGGAFMEGYGSIETHDNIVRSLALQTKSIVISVGYRVAPTYIFPTAIEDSYTALLWAEKNAVKINGNINKVAVAGDSSGGNIATVVAAMSRDRYGPELKAQLLFYPLTTFQDDLLPSRDLYDSGYYLLSRNVMQKARESYTPEETMWMNPYTSPLYSVDLSELPPTLVITAEFDPLRDEGEAYAKRLVAFGVPVKAIRYSGVMHGFISFYEVMYKGKQGLQQATSFVKKAFDDDIKQTPYFLHIADDPKGYAKYRDQLEAYAIAGFLLSKKWSNKLSQG